MMTIIKLIIIRTKNVDMLQKRGREDFLLLEQILVPTIKIKERKEMEQEQCPYKEHQEISYSKHFTLAKRNKTTIGIRPLNIIWQHIPRSTYIWNSSNTHW